MNIFEKLPDLVILSLDVYITDEIMQSSQKIIAVYSYCRALYDLGLITLIERIEFTDYCVEKILKGEGLI